MTTREDIAAALSEVDDVTGFAKRPTSTKEGDAWPILVRMDRSDGLTFENTWGVLVQLPADKVSAADWFDEHAALVASALEAVAFVDSVETRFDTVNGGGETNYMQVTMRREHP